MPQLFLCMKTTGQGYTHKLINCVFSTNGYELMISLHQLTLKQIIALAAYISSMLSPIILLYIRPIHQLIIMSLMMMMMMMPSYIPIVVTPHYVRCKLLTTPDLCLMHEIKGKLLKPLENGVQTNLTTTGRSFQQISNTSELACNRHNKFDATAWTTE